MIDTAPLMVQPVTVSCEKITPVELTFMAAFVLGFVYVPAIADSDDPVS
jgi:hypothetical protein